jgi:uncharacterized protein
MEKYLSWITKNRKIVVIFTAITTLALVAQLRSLQVIIDPDSTLPQTHPYIATGNLIEKVFGNKFTILVGITPRQGTVYQAPILAKVARITERLSKNPYSIKSNILSLSARKTKNISGTTDGMTVQPLMEKAPSTPGEIEALKQAVAKNPVYTDLLVSRDDKTTQIVTEFKKTPGGFKTIVDAARDAVQPELDESVDIRISGLPVFLGLLEIYSARMGFLFPIALLIIGLIHYEAFRTLQALILPLVTALLAVAWSMGTLGLLGEPFDVFNTSTPILILAIAAGHAVQILKRYYEEYAVLRTREPGGDPQSQSERAVIRSLTRVGPVMIVACTVAALGFFSLDPDLRDLYRRRGLECPGPGADVYPRAAHDAQGAFPKRNRPRAGRDDLGPPRAPPLPPRLDPERLGVRGHPALGRPSFPGGIQASGREQSKRLLLRKNSRTSG